MSASSDDSETKRQWLFSSANYTEWIPADSPQARQPFAGKLSMWVVTKLVAANDTKRFSNVTYSIDNVSPFASQVPVSLHLDFNDCIN